MNISDGLTEAEMEFITILVSNERARLWTEEPSTDAWDTEIRAQCIERCESIINKLDPELNKEDHEQ